MNKFCIIDVETTGLDPEKDEIIELGLIECGFPAGFKEPVILNMFSALQEMEVPKEITEITGISTEMTQGRDIDWEIVEEYLSDVSFCVAHNAAFDTAFLRRHLPNVEMRWYCSWKHIDWASKGASSQKVGHLAADNGFCNPFPHRALTDALVVFNLIKEHMRELVNNGSMRHYRVLAYGAPFAMKDRLKEDGFRWDPEKKVWYKDVKQDILLEAKGFVRNITRKFKVEEIPFLHWGCDE